MEGLEGELVYFPTKDKIILSGLFVSSKRKSDSAVIHIHGLEGTFYRNNYAVVLAKMLSNNGFNCLSIEQRGSYSAVGFKKTVKGKGYLTAGGGFERFEDCLYDIQAAIKFLKSRGIKRIFLEGHSTGCQKVTYYQYRKQDKIVKGIILSAPCDDYNIQKKGLGRKFKQTFKLAKTLYKKDRLAHMPHSYVKRSFGAGRFISFSDLKNVEARLFNYDSAKLKEFSKIRQPILAIFGSRDEHILKPAKEYMRILNRDSCSVKFDYRIINNTNHGFDGKEEDLAKIVTSWLKKTG